MLEGRRSLPLFVSLADFAAIFQFWERGSMLPYLSDSFYKVFRLLIGLSSVKVKQCQDQFNFILPSVALERRRTKFIVFRLRRLACRCYIYIVIIDIVLFVFMSAVRLLLCILLFLTSYLMVTKYFHWDIMVCQQHDEPVFPTNVYTQITLNQMNLEKTY